MAENPEKKESSLRSILFGIYVSGVLGIVIAALMPDTTFRKVGNNRNTKACYTNTRIIQGAIEMYNMDAKELMNELDIDTLIKDHYLKEKPNFPEESCSYSFDKDISEEGLTFCKYHGSSCGKIAGSLIEEKGIEKRNYKIQMIICAFFWPIIIPVLLFVFLITGNFN